MPPVRIVVLPDGPLLVEGDCAVVDRDGNPFPPRVGKKPGVYLCRCGRSGLKPWCDGSHKTAASPPESGSRPPDAR